MLKIRHAVEGKKISGEVAANGDEYFYTTLVDLYDSVDHPRSGIVLGLLVYKSRGRTTNAVQIHGGGLIVPLSVDVVDRLVESIPTENKKALKNK